MGCTHVETKKPPITRRPSQTQLPPSDLMPKPINYKHARALRRCPNGHALSYASCGLHSVKIACKRCGDDLANVPMYHCRSCESKDFYCSKCVSNNRHCDHNKEVVQPIDNWAAAKKYTKVIPVCDVCKKHCVAMYECKECSFCSCINCSQTKLALTGGDCYPFNNHYMVPYKGDQNYNCTICNGTTNVYECIGCDKVLCKICLYMELHLQCTMSSDGNHHFLWKKWQDTKVCTFFHTRNYTTNTGYICQDCGWLLCNSCIAELQKVSFALESTPLKTTERNYTEIRCESKGEEHLCKICYEEKQLATFVPCGHQGVCFGCASSMKTCPVCNTKIDQMIRTFAI